MDLLNYIKEFFSKGLSRKRRRQEEYFAVRSPKIRRLSTYNGGGYNECINLLDDMVSNSSDSSWKHKSRLDDSGRYRRYRDIPTIIIDDEDEITKDFRRDNRNSSLHKNYSKNDDVIFKKVIHPSPDNRFSFTRQGSSSRRNSSLYITASNLNGSSRSNDELSPIFKPSLSRPIIKSAAGLSSATSPTHRLEEKNLYKQLLMGNSPSFNDSSIISGSFGNITAKKSELTRGQKMVNLVKQNKSKLIDVIDLTEPKKKLSTQETIKNVIDKFDNDVINLNSDSSDVEVLPNPPSPKPDFEVNRVNSLKTFVDSTEPQHDDWITNLLSRHREVIESREREIEEQLNHKKKLSEINNELRTKLLADNIDRCLKIKETLLPVEFKEESVPLPVLTDKQEQEVIRAFDKSLDEREILVSKFNLNISRYDILTLRGLNWLNDEVINFYMNLIIERGKDPKYPTAYAMNTFFYPRVSKDGHSSVRRWTKKVDIFSYDIMVVPIHLRMHWCMAIIDFRNKTITYFDSMGSPNKLCLDSLFKYLRDEHLDKKKSPFDATGWELINAKDIPQQMNGSDCGVFSCTFAEFLSRDAKINFSQDDMPYLRKKMVVEILEGRLLIS